MGPPVWFKLALLNVTCEVWVLYALSLSKCLRGTDVIFCLAG